MASQETIALGAAPAEADARPSIYDLGRAELAAALAGMGQPAYRARQVWRWLYAGLAEGFEAMTDLPRGTREALADRFRLQPMSLAAATDSHDSPATKLLFRLADGAFVETVLMHYGDEAAVAPDDGEAAGGEADGEHPAARERHTVCLSTQAGCAMGCVFCATGQMGLLRDLSRGECVAQVVECARRLRASGARLSHVVFMGMGEPLANWPATWGAVETLADPDGFGLSPRRLTISTVGIVPGIRRLSESGLPVRLAVSLHAPDDALRGRLVAVNRVYGLDDILAACRDYQAAGGRRITFEYVLIDGVNDSPAQARALARRVAGIHGHFNLIPLNPTAGSPLRPSAPARAAAFAAALRAAGFSCTLRLRRGIDIQAGCGQLRMRAAPGQVGRSLAPARDPQETSP